MNYTNVNLKEVIGKAYKVQQYQITGPDWINTERLDIVARFAPHSAQDQIPLMLQALLADRFKLTLHRETRELPMYALVVAKNGPKFKSTETETGTSLELEPDALASCVARAIDAPFRRVSLGRGGTAGGRSDELEWNVRTDARLGSGQRGRG